MRRGPGSVYRKLESLRFLATRDRRAVARFVTNGPVLDRVALVCRFVEATNGIRGYHTLGEMLEVTHEILLRPGAVVVEAGAAAGGGTAKLSLAVRRVMGELHVFDTFRGMPANDETHQTLSGRPLHFRAGAFLGRINSVRRALDGFGAPEVCTFHKGLFADTLPVFQQTVDVALLDVDLLSSTRDCLTALFPRLARDGILFSQDGHIRAIVELLGNRRFWEDEVGVPVPRIDGLGTQKLVRIRPSRGVADLERSAGIELDRSGCQ